MLKREQKYKLQSAEVNQLFSRREPSSKFKNELLLELGQFLEITAKSQTDKV